jgi:hypothetical protein
MGGSEKRPPPVDINIDYSYMEVDVTTEHGGEWSLLKCGHICNSYVERCCQCQGLKRGRCSICRKRRQPAVKGG